MTREIDRDMQAAYVDGALSPEDAARVVIHLADNPEDQAYVDRLTELNRVLSDAFDAPLHEPIPDEIENTIRPAAPRRRRRLRLPALPQLAWPAAGLAAAMLLLVIGWPELDKSAPGARQHTGAVATNSALHRLLETQPSGHSAAAPEDGTLTLIATFIDKNARPCREYELRHAEGRSLTRSVACRAPEQVWSVVGAFSENLLPPEDLAEAYLPAGGPADTGLTAALDALGAGASLGPAEESQLIENAWEKQ